MGKLLHMPAPNSSAPSARRVATGIGAAVLIASLFNPTISRKVSTVGSEAYNTVANIGITRKYGDAGIIKYTQTTANFPYEVTPRGLAREIAGEGAIAREIGLADLLARYITRANGLPDENTAIRAGQNINTLVYGYETGRSLGSLVDAVEKVK